MESRGYRNDLKREEILAIDIATLTGYYSVHESGTWNFNESKHRNDNKQHKAFYDTLTSFIQKHKIRFIIAEDINVNNYFTDIRKLSQFHGLLLLVCDELSLPDPHYINVATLKKWATGNGKATKQEMMQACINKYNFHPKDDNEADAFLMFHYYIRKYRL